MVNSDHPLAVDPQAVRLLEHTLLRTEELLGADSFSLDGDVVTFRRRASAHGPATTWQGPARRLARAGRFSTSRIVCDDAMTIGRTVSEGT